jgi:hypothetical protein
MLNSWQTPFNAIYSLLRAQGFNSSRWKQNILPLRSSWRGPTNLRFETPSCGDILQFMGVFRGCPHLTSIHLTTSAWSRNDFQYMEVLASLYDLDYRFPATFASDEASFPALIKLNILYLLFGSSTCLIPRGPNPTRLHLNKWASPESPCTWPHAMELLCSLPRLENLMIFFSEIDETTLPL